LSLQTASSRAYPRGKKKGKGEKEGGGKERGGEKRRALSKPKITEPGAFPEQDLSIQLYSCRRNELSREKREGGRKEREAENDIIEKVRLGKTQCVFFFPPLLRPV